MAFHHNINHRPSTTESQTSTIREFDTQQRPSNAGSQTTVRDFSTRENDADTIITLNNNNNNDISEEEDDKISFQSMNSTQKAFQFTYTNDKIPEDTVVHPQQPHTKVFGQERITIVEDVLNPRSEYCNTVHSPTIEKKKKWSFPFIKKITKKKWYMWMKKLCESQKYRYAFQSSIGFTIAALFVVVDPISEIFPNAFWVGISVVSVFDNTVGGLLSLSLQRLLGTLIGGMCSIVIMTATRAIFHPIWEWEASVLLCFLMFIQVFFISLIKISTNYAYVGNIGLLTTVILILSGYSDLISHRMSYIAEMGAWRTLNLVIGILIASVVAVLVFPLKASNVMRQNLGKAMEDAADLYEKSSQYYLDFSGSTSGTVNQILTTKKASTLIPPTTTSTREEENEVSLKEAIARSFSNHRPPNPNIAPDMQDQIRQQLEDSNKFWTHDAITNTTNQAFTVLSSLQTESTRLRNVANEYKVQIIFHIFGGGKERCKRDLRRAKRYNESIEAMKRIVWPLVSFRLLLPLISISQTTSRLEEATNINKSETSQNATDALKERITPTRETLESFSDSLRVMRLIGNILKEYNTPVSEFPDEWLEIDRMVTAGNLHIQRELKQTVKISMYGGGETMDGLKLLSYYGFLVRCSMIWDGLRVVTEKLSPLNGTLSRASSMGIGTPLPNRESVPAAE